MRHAGWVAGGAAAVLVAAGAITYAVADGDDSGTRAPAADSADAGFARDMAVHHQQAVHHRHSLPQLRCLRREAQRMGQAASRLAFSSLSPVRGSRPLLREGRGARSSRGRR